WRSRPQARRGFGLALPGRYRVRPSRGAGGCLRTARPPGREGEVRVPQSRKPARPPRRRSLARVLQDPVDLGDRFIAIGRGRLRRVQQRLDLLKLLRADVAVTGGIESVSKLLVGIFDR